ncbi:hypothetical protein M409DRAFT_60396 [Zasmidium cellare ATCC 36951]|uniref:Uncharacterized protein n=1 Tax=Zasmidium cellare ATCC 36951 TaxID=1080233 RepID=A0A6A6BZ57_ZASCE|nr:uncharacterized protein M409DRAFT_60396 [Zasmidium cellare ATCC 36951]KAF2159995.1 hypothetical protein M409DRAFT_60396 [Zasmidium cellare ATCC 36951]
MQLKLITAAIASLAVGSAIAGPIPQPLDVEVRQSSPSSPSTHLLQRSTSTTYRYFPLSLELLSMDALALYARAEQDAQAQQAQQAQAAAQAQQADQAHQGQQGAQAKQGEQAKQGDQWLFPGGINAGVSYNGLGYGAYFNGLGINAYARGYGNAYLYNNAYRGYGYGRRGWNRWGW